jgi:hypothetical protein
VTIRGIWRFVVGCVWTTKWRGPDWARGSGVVGENPQLRYRGGSRGACRRDRLVNMLSENLECWYLEDWVQLFPAGE